MTKTAPASDRTVLIGDNELISPHLLEISHAALEQRLSALERRADQVPEIDSDEDSGPWQETIADLDSLARDIEATRVQVKDPFERAVEIANGFFFAMHAPRKGQTPGRLQTARNKIVAEVQGYLQRKEARARAEREAEARRQREIAEDARRKEEAAAAARRKAEDEERSRAATNAAAREAAAGATAAAAEARQFEAEQQAQAKPADLARTRSDGGTLATLQVEWDFSITDLDQVKGAPLWQYVPRSGKEAAIRAYIRANAPRTIESGKENEWQPLVGVRMVCKRKLQVR